MKKKKWSWKKHRKNPEAHQEQKSHLLKPHRKRRRATLVQRHTGAANVQHLQSQDYDANAQQRIQVENAASTNSRPLIIQGR
jgi:hypothetical protein